MIILYRGCALIAGITVRITMFAEFVLHLMSRPERSMMKPCANLPDLRLWGSCHTAIV